MSRHRIFGCEADRPKPLAYIHVLRSGRRSVTGYVAAAALGSLFTVIAAAAVALGGGIASGLH